MSDHHLGLAKDLDTLLRQLSGRRRMLRWLSAAAVPLAGCGGGGSATEASTSTDAGSSASVDTVFPGCYSGRMPHMHFEVYRSTATATSCGNELKTSQIAFPVATCQAVVATSGYAASMSNLAGISFASDTVFGDGVTLELASVTGNTTDGFVATLQVGIPG